MLCDRCNMLIALCCGGPTRNRCRSGRNDNRRSRMTFGDGIIYRLAIIRAIRCHRSNICIDLIEQVRYFRDIANIIQGQFHRDDFMRVSIHAKV